MYPLTEMCQRKFSFFIFANCLQLITVLEIVQGSKIFEGRSCSIGGYSNVPGVCTLLSDCPSALSNFRAGINPSVCYLENQIPLICCQTGQRISARKCDEYAQQLADLQSGTPGFVPFYTGGYDKDTNRPQPGSGSTGNSPGGCNSNKELPLISGGRPADRDEMSFTVALGYDETGNGNGILWKCGGTLISEQYVLTAAHCLDVKVSKMPTRVLIGDKHLQKLDTFSSQRRVEAYVDKIIIHPDYKRPTKYNDIGLIKLDRQIKFNRMIYPACLPQAETRPEIISEFLTAGWGRLEYFGKRGDVLQVVNITKYSLRECNSVYKSDTELPEGILKSQICAGDKLGNKDTCDGDSGGPLTKPDKVNCMQYLLGITSFGDQFCGSGTPAVYTNVQSYVDWIEAIVWKEEI